MLFILIFNLLHEFFWWRGDVLSTFNLVSFKFSEQLGVITVSPGLESALHGSGCSRAKRINFVLNCTCLNAKASGIYVVQSPVINIHFVNDVFCTSTSKNLISLEINEYVQPSTEIFCIKRYTQWVWKLSWPKIFWLRGWLVYWR